MGPHGSDAGRARGRLTVARSSLELLHPNGVARGPGDVVVVDEATPDAAELLREHLEPDGLAYVRLPARGRAALARSAGLQLGPAVFEVGGLIVPVERNALRWALGSRAPSTRTRLAGRVPVPAFRLLAPAAIARRAGARPLGAWLLAHGSGTAVVAGRRAAFLVGENGLELVAKVGEGLPARRELSEGRALAELGPWARAAGADIPAPVDEGELGGRPLLVMTGIEGRPASVLLAQRPGRADTLVERIGGWLLRWNSATAEETALTRELLDSEVLGPARAAGVLDSYLSELEGRCQALEGRAVKLVAAHNDLTTANVLVAQGRPLGVVDWDTAQRRALPLGDLFYALADAQAATNGFADRLQAFIARFDGPVSAIETEVTKTLGVDGDIADLCFHACWLRHAANESRRAEAEERPFLDIVHAIAEQRIRMGG